MTSASEDKPTCILDRNILNTDTVMDMEDIGLSIFAAACGKNRGVFVLTEDPNDHHTYSCINLPSRWAADVGASENVTVATSNQIKDNIVNASLAPQQGVDLLDLLTKAVYESTADADQIPYACDINGLAKLRCPGINSMATSSFESPIRSVTLPRELGGKMLTENEATAFYTQQDFDDMKHLGLNTVQIPVPVGTGKDSTNFLTVVLGMTKNAGLQAIVRLQGMEVHASNNEDLDDTVEMVQFCANHDACKAVILPDPSEATYNAARAASQEDLALFLPVSVGNLQGLIRYNNDRQLYVALDLEHSQTVADVASDTSLDDRMKMYYHESLACINRSPIEYVACYKHMPVFVSSGFDLSIDDCAFRQEEKEFHDYGQCDRFNETIASPWWHRHRASFASRQAAAYEQGLGWSFTAYKLMEANGNTNNEAVIDSPAKLLALKDVTAAGLFPALSSKDNNEIKDFDATACLNTPENDFALGDKTLPPTPAPPPSCGNGWWNYDLNACEYWVPPTSAPTLTPESPAPRMMGSAAIGALVATIAIGSILGLLRRNQKSKGYSNIPSVAVMDV